MCVPAMKARSQASVVLVLALLGYCLPASGTMAVSRLEQQDYRTLVLLETREGRDGWEACFLLDDGSVELARVDDHVGENLATIASISDNGIELLEMVPVNRGEWAEAKIAWPLAEVSDDEREKCKVAH